MSRKWKLTLAVSAFLLLILFVFFGLSANGSTGGLQGFFETLFSYKSQPGLPGSQAQSQGFNPAVAPTATKTAVPVAFGFIPFTNADCPAEGFPVALNQANGFQSQLTCQYYTQGGDTHINFSITYSAKAGEAQSSYDQKKANPGSGAAQPCDPANDRLKINTATELLCLFSETSNTDATLIWNAGWGVLVYKDAFMIEVSLDSMGPMTADEAGGFLKNAEALTKGIADLHLP